MEGFKLLFTLPTWQKQIINHVIKEEKKDIPNKELLEKAKKACIKTQDEKFMFAYAYFTDTKESRIEVVKELLKLNPGKWAIPCALEITRYIGAGVSLEMIDENLCIDALIKAGDCENLYKFARTFGHDVKIENYLIQRREADLILDYAKNVKDADMVKIGEFIQDYVDSSTYAYMERFNKIQKNKIKKSKSLEESMEILGDSFER